MKRALLLLTLFAVGCKRQHAVVTVTIDPAINTRLVKTALGNLKPYLDDERMAAMEVREIERVELDILQMEHETDAAKLEKEATQMDDDFDALWAKDCWLSREKLI